MKKLLKNTTLIILTFFCVSTAFARWITKAEAKQAATATLAQPLFQKTFPNATISDVVELDGLWCITLEPNGYLIFSGSTLQVPLLNYSKGTYTTPKKGSPAFQIETAHRTRAKALEASETNVPTKDLRWDALLNPLPSIKRLTASAEIVEEEEEEEEELPTSAEIELTTSWNQCAPWNDFCPQIRKESVAEDFYENRVPVGCGATMYSQIMYFYEWPARIDTIYTNALLTENCALQNPEGDLKYEMRFHGGLPIEWNTLKDKYWNITDEGWEQLFTSEIERLAIARVGFLVDVLSTMEFDGSETGGGATTLENVGNNDWYEFGLAVEKEDAEPFTTKQLQTIKETIAAGLPIPAGITGHAIVIYGYQEHDNGDTYLKLNYGWGDEDNSNTFYEANTSTLNSWLIGHTPKMQVQVAPLPKVVNINEEPTVMWMVPDCYEDVFTGFTVSATLHSSDKETLVDYIPSTEVLEDTTDSQETYGIVVLQDETGAQIKSLVINEPPTDTEKKYYHFPEAFIPTEESTFNCQLMNIGSEEASAITVEIQLWSDDDSTWKTLASFNKRDQEDSNASPGNVEIPLEDYAEQFCRLRIATYFIFGDDEEEGEEEEEGDEEEEPVMCYAMHSIKISDIYSKGTSKTWKVKAGVREQQLTGLTTNVGTRYHIRVTPKTAEEPAESGETFTRFTTESVKLPIIESVKNLSDNSALVDGTLFEGDLDGKSGIRVTCNDAVTEIRALASCTTLIPDDAITIYRYDEHIFDVVIDSPQTVEDLDGSRMIITLEARTAQGNVTYKDIVFAMREATPTISYVAPVVEFDTDDDTLEIPHYWFRKYDIATEEAPSEDWQALAEKDSDNDGFSNWQEFICGTSPVNSEDKLRILGMNFNDEGELESIEYTPKTSEAGNIYLEGKRALDDEAWEPADLKTHHFFRLRATNK